MRIRAVQQDYCAGDVPPRQPRRRKVASQGARVVRGVYEEHIGVQPAHQPVNMSQVYGAPHGASEQASIASTRAPAGEVDAAPHLAQGAGATTRRSAAPALRRSEADATSGCTVVHRRPAGRDSPRRCRSAYTARDNVARTRLPRRASCRIVAQLRRDELPRRGPEGGASFLKEARHMARACSSASPGATAADDGCPSADVVVFAMLNDFRESSRTRRNHGQGGRSPCLHRRVHGHPSS